MPGQLVCVLIVAVITLGSAAYVLLKDSKDFSDTTEDSDKKENDQ